LGRSGGCLHSAAGLFGLFDPVLKGAASVCPFAGGKRPQGTAALVFGGLQSCAGLLGRDICRL
tara:strand:+ start:452 stop:640 length:189 start_codon:yes stop_codon:yes gene_type:complete